MEYRNKKTGFSFFSNCKISGQDWKIATDKDAAENKVQQESQPVEQTSNAIEETPVEPDDLAGITVSEIKQELDAMGIEYNPRSKKQELYDLMMGK